MEQKRSPYVMVVSDEFFELAARPDHIPKPLYDEFFGFINKEHATTYYDESDILNILEQLQIERIKAYHRLTERQKARLKAENWEQIFAIAYALARKSYKGFLITQYRTQRTVEESNIQEEKRGGLLNFLKRSEESERP